MLKLIDYKDHLPIRIDLLNVKEYPWHTHRDIQIFYVIEGTVDLKLTYTTYPLEKDDIHFVHSDDVHGISSVTETNLLFILSISVEYFSKFFPNLKSQVFSTRIKENVLAYKSQQLELKYYIFSILKEINKKEVGYEEKVCQISKDLINALYKDFRGFSVNRADKVFELRFSHDLFQMDRISRIVSYVYDNYAYKLSLADIALDEHINKYYLSHLFQRFVGENFRDFVSMVRVEMSEVKVLSTSLSISQIAQESGFSNAKYYIEHFENWFGMHPKEYREKMQHKTIDYQEPQIIRCGMESIAEQMNSYLNQFPVYMADFNHTATVTANINFFGVPCRTCHLLEGCMIDVINPDLYDGNYLEDNFFVLYEDLKKKDVKVKISIVEENSATAQNSEDMDPFAIYYDTFAQDFCITLLSRLTENKRLQALEQVELIDSPQNTDGLLTINGLRKPAFYLYRFLAKLSSQIVEINPCYMITREERNFQILAFNAHEEHDLTLNFHLAQVLNNYKLTEHRLHPSVTCIDYWSQLNFQHPISHEDHIHIENMSMPKIKFEIIPKSQEYIYSITLNSKEIVFILIEETL